MRFAYQILSILSVEQNENWKENSDICYIDEIEKTIRFHSYEICS